MGGKVVAVAAPAAVAPRLSASAGFRLLLQLMMMMATATAKATTDTTNAVYIPQSVLNDAKVGRWVFSYPPWDVSVCIVLHCGYA